MMKILITRPRAQAEEFAKKLQMAGFETIFFPVIEIQPIRDNDALDRALENLDCYEWVVFTSVNAVDVVFDVLARNEVTGQTVFGAGGLRRSSGNDRVIPKFAAIGPRTAEALQSRGVRPDYVPEEYVAEAILPGLEDLRGKWVLLPRAEIARKALPDAIVNAGGIAHEIAVYKTLPVQPDPEGLEALQSGVDVITLTSPSTVQNFVAMARRIGLDPLNLPDNPVYACIGPITEQAAREEGLANLVVARKYTTEGLTQVISSLEAS